MPNIHPNFSTRFEPDDLDNLCKLAKHLDLTLVAGQHHGDGSPRQLMIELAHAVKREGVNNVAACLRNIIPPQG